MKNNFTAGTYALFDLGGYCHSWETGINNADCLHHIMGRSSNSPYNAAPLNNKNDHQPEGRKGRPALTSFAVRSAYLKKTKKFLDDIGYRPTPDDLLFLQKNSKYY